MDQDRGAITRGSSEGGVAGEHGPAAEFHILVGPATSNEFNTVRLRLIPVACWRVDDLRFDFDSSFVLPEIAAEMKTLASLVGDHPDCPLSIFGHADPVGSDAYNKILSGRRAQAIYGLLTRRSEIWEDLFSNTGHFAAGAPGDRWGDRALHVMQSTLSASTGGDGSATAPPGSASQRKELFLAYMDALCGPDFKLRATDFLAQGADAKGKGDIQGCGEFNPVLLFSQPDQSRFANSQDPSVVDERNRANAPNRRVMGLLFRKGSRVTSDTWPCPRAIEGGAGCRKRFFSDGEQHRGTHSPDGPRKFQDTQDTFACRFYQRISTGSPCEGILYTFRVRLFDRFGRPIPKARYQVVLQGREQPPDTADENGDILVRTQTLPATCVVRWSAPEDPDVHPAGSETDAPAPPL